MTDHQAAAERERIARLLFACQTCGDIHQPQDTGALDKHGNKIAPSWAHPRDGHPYQPPVWGDPPASRRTILAAINPEGTDLS